MPKAGTVEVDVEPGMSSFGDKLARGIGTSNISLASKEMTRVGNKLSMFLTLPIAAGFGLAFAEANESIKVGKQTEAVIRSTGGAANITAKEVGALAGRLSEKVGIDDEAIQSGENLLLTFRNIRNEAGKGNDIFSQATKLTLDMSVAMGTDMRTAALQVGKALNDPIRGMTALGRVGVQFTEQQRSQIKAMVESGDLMGAQKIILHELALEFAGSAEAAATPFDKLKVKVQNLAEEVGFKAMPIAEKFIGVIGGLSDAFLGLPDWAQTFVVGGIAAAGALGPVLKFSGALLGVVDRARVSNLQLPSMAAGMKGLGAAAAIAGGFAGLALLGSSLAEATGNAQGFQLKMHGSEIGVEGLTTALAKLNDEQLVRTFQTLTSIGDGLEGGLLDDLPNASQLFRQLATDSEGTAVRLIASMEGQGISTGRFKRILAEVREEGSRAKADLNGTSGAVEGVGGAAAIAAGDVDMFKGAIDELIGIHLDAEAAQLKYRDSIDAISKSLFENGATFDINTEKGRANRQVVLESTGSVLSLAESMVQETGDVAGANFVLQAHRGHLIDVMRQAGLTEDEIADYLETLGLTPENIETLVDAETADANRKLDETGKKADDVGKKRPTPKADLDPAIFYSKSADVVRKIDDVHRKRPTPVTDLNRDPFEGGIKVVGNKLAFTGGLRVFPHVDADTSQFDAKIGAVFSKIGSLAAQKIVVPFTGGSAYIGGPVIGPRDQPVPMVLHGGEFVLSADVVDRIKKGRPSRGADMNTPLDFGTGAPSAAAAEAAAPVRAGVLVGVGGDTYNVTVNAKVVRSDREMEDLVTTAVLEARRRGNL